MENVVVNNIQHKINQMQRASAHQYAYPESESDSDQEETYNNTENKLADSKDDASDIVQTSLAQIYKGSDEVI